MVSALAEGAEVNGCTVGKEAGRTALIGAAVGVKLLKVYVFLEVAVQRSSKLNSELSLPPAGVTVGL